MSVLLLTKYNISCFTLQDRFKRKIVSYSEACFKSVMFLTIAQKIGVY